MTDYLAMSTAAVLIGVVNMILSWWGYFLPLCYPKNATVFIPIQYTKPKTMIITFLCNYQPSIESWTLNKNKIVGEIAIALVVLQVVLLVVGWTLTGLVLQQGSTTKVTVGASTVDVQSVPWIMAISSAVIHGCISVSWVAEIIGAIACFPSRASRRQRADQMRQMTAPQRNIDA